MTKRARTIWIEDDEWNAAKEKAAKDERSVSYLVARLLRDFSPDKK